jgi:predicted AAA+ superfamily ATPase
LSLDAFYTDEGRAACQAALIHLGTLVDAFDAYLLIGGFPQAVADFRRTAQVSDGFTRDLWDIVQSDLLRLGVSRPEQGLRLLERIAASLTGPVVLRSLAEDLGVSHHRQRLAGRPRRHLSHSAALPGAERRARPAQTTQDLPDRSTAGI